MLQVALNYWAIVGATITAIILGFLWYGPVFGRYWMKLMGLAKDDIAAWKKKSMGRTYAIMAVGTFAGAYVLAHFVDYLAVTGVRQALQVAFWLWFGFVAPVTLGSVLWEGKSWALWVLNTTYNLLVLMVEAVILVLWV